MKKVFRNSFLTIELYWRGLVIGFFYDEDRDFNIFLPFVSIRIIPKLVPKIFVWGFVGFLVGTFITTLFV